MRGQAHLSPLAFQESPVDFILSLVEHQELTKNRSSLLNSSKMHIRNVSYIEHSDWLKMKAHFLRFQILAYFTNANNTSELVYSDRSTPADSEPKPFLTIPNPLSSSFTSSIMDCISSATSSLPDIISANYLQSISNNSLLSSSLCPIISPMNSTENSSEVYSQEWSLVFSPWLSITIALVVLFCSILTFGGNLLVFIAFFIEKKLQITNNYFLLSLAVADGCVGLISVNFWLVMYLGNAHWPFGWPACVFWIFCDYVWCTTSIYHVFIISIDRYWSVSQPANYRSKMNPRMALIMIIPTWLVSIVWWLALIVGHPLVVGNLVIEGMCYANYWGIGLWTYLSTSITYWIPVVVITTLYIHIYRIAKKLKKKRKLKSEMIRKHLVTAAKATSALQRLKTKTQNQDAPNENNNQAADAAEDKNNLEVNRDPENALTKLSRKIAVEAEAEDSNQLKVIQENKSKLSLQRFDKCSLANSFKDSQNNSSLAVDSGCDFGNNGNDGSIELAPKTPELKPSRLSNSTGVHTAGDVLESSSSSRGAGTTPGGGGEENQAKLSAATLKKVENVIKIIKTPPAVKRLVKRQSNDKKAMKTLTFLLGAFILCWTPWNIAEVVNGIWGADTVNAHLYQFTWFLTYFNSALNPLCYAFANTVFKDTFIRILSCGKIRPNAGPSYLTPNPALRKTRRK